MLIPPYDIPTGNTVLLLIPPLDLRLHFRPCLFCILSLRRLHLHTVGRPGPAGVFLVPRPHAIPLYHPLRMLVSL